jgi:hypothetical protein
MSVCLSRACLGKTSFLIVRKWRKPPQGLERDEAVVMDLLRRAEQLQQLQQHEAHGDSALTKADRSAAQNCYDAAVAAVDQRDVHQSPEREAVARLRGKSAAVAAAMEAEAEAKRTALVIIVSSDFPYISLNLCRACLGISLNLCRACLGNSL